MPVSLCIVFQCKPVVSGKLDGTFSYFYLYLEFMTTYHVEFNFWLNILKNYALKNIRKQLR